MCNSTIIVLCLQLAWRINLNISVSGPRGAELDLGLQAYTTLAIKSFAKQLGISRLRTNLDVRIHQNLFVDNAHSMGLCESVDERNFRIDIALFGNWLSTLAHEMVHVKQFAKGELDPCMSRWKSNRYVDHIDYWDQPWEKEARRLQNKLVLVFEDEE